MKSFYYFNISKGTLPEQEVTSKQIKQEYFSKYFVSSQQPGNLFYRVLLISSTVS